MSIICDSLGLTPVLFSGHYLQQGKHDTFENKHSSNTLKGLFVCANQTGSIYMVQTGSIYMVM